MHNKLYLSNRSRKTAAVLGLLALLASSAPALNTLHIQPDPAEFYLLAAPAFTNVTIQRSEPFGFAETVTFESSDTNVFDLQPPYSVTFLPGETNRTMTVRLRALGCSFLQSTGSDYADRNAVSAPVCVLRPAALDIRPDPVNIALSVDSNVTAEILRQAIGPGYLTAALNVTLTSGDTSVFRVATGVVNFPAGGGADVSQTQTVVITGVGQGSALLTATAPDYAARQVVVNVSSNPALTLSLAPDPVNVVLASGGISTVRLTRAGSVAGILNSPLTVTLTSADAGVFTVPASVNFPATMADSQTLPVVVQGVAAGQAGLSAAAAGYTNAGALVRVFMNTVRLIGANPDPIEIVLSGGSVASVDIFREGLVPGDLNAPLEVGLFPSAGGLLNLSTALVSFAAEPAGVVQASPVLVEGLAPGSADLILIPSDPAYASASIPVHIYTQQFLGLPALVYVTTGGTANVTLRRAGFTSGPLLATLSSAGSPTYQIRGDGPVFQAGDTVLFPPGVSVVSFQVKGVSPTVPGSARLVAMAPGYPAVETPIFVVGEGDSDGDGLPDWWELFYFGDLTQGPTDDPDGDGLWNITEYQVNTDPTSPDSDGDGIGDYLEDADGDTLTNGEEQDIYLTSATLADTDDDGINDNQELFQQTDPRLSVSPYVMRALRFLPGGVGEVRAPGSVAEGANSRLNLTNFTVEVWVKPTALPAAGVRQPLVRRLVTNGLAAAVVNYEVGVKDGGKPYARFQSRTGGGQAVEIEGVNALPRETWTHLAARYSGGSFALFVNGVPVRSTNSGLAPATGQGDLVFGGTGYVGDLREVRVWRGGRSNQDIADYANSTLYFNRETAQPGVLNLIGDDGHLRTVTGSVDPVTGLKVDDLTTWTLEAWVRSVGGAGTIISRWNGANDDDNDYNYFLKVGEDGRITAGFSIIYTAVETTGSGTNLEVNTEIVINRSINDMLSATRINDGQWHHVAYVRGATETLLYVDGMLDSRQAALLIPIPPANTVFQNVRVRSLAGPLVVGKGLAGEMDEVRVWNRALLSSELERYKGENLMGNEIGLVSYFSFDNHNTVTARERAALRSRTDEYGILVPGAYISSGLIEPAVGAFSLNPIRVLRLSDLVAYLSADDNGATVEDYVYALDFRYAGVRNPFVQFVLASGGGIDPNLDSDGDGLPDGWETLHGLDPNSSVGDDGAYGDPDGDGLNNRAEFLANTDPRNFDTDGDGFSDYDTRPSPGARSYGEQYTDGDGMDDDWERQYPAAVSPLIFDAHEDPDGDGWSNYAEFMNLTDPTDPLSVPRPALKVQMKYGGVNRQGPIVVQAYSHPGMDGLPDAVGTAGQSQTIAESLLASVTAAGTVHSGNLPSIPVVPGTLRLRIGQLVFQDQGTGVLRSEGVVPVRFGQVDYASGAWSVNTAPNVISVGTGIWATWAQFTGISSFPFEGTLAVLDGYLREGPAWLFAFIDRDGSGTWDPGEPAGMAQGQPLNIGFGEAPATVIGLTDFLPGFPRFNWEATGFNQDTVTVVRASGTGWPVMMRRAVTARNWIHEGDYLYVGLTAGVAPGASDAPSYRWYVGEQTDELVENWSTPPAQPTLHSPLGELVFARPSFVWSTANDRGVTYRVEVRAGSTVGDVVLDRVVPSPYRDNQGRCSLDMANVAGEAFYCGDRLPNGTYYWRVQAQNQRRHSAFSDWRTFLVNLQDSPAGAYTISGTLHYDGPIAASNIVVQAFRSPGFSGLPDAQIRMNASGAFKLRGLPAGTYYVRAFMDQNRNGKLDYWESSGFIKDYLYGTDYDIRPLTVPANKSGQRLVVRDRDTNANGYPDAWEIAIYGSLTQTPGGLWFGAIALGNGWKWSPWIGYFFEAGYGWIWHAEHGWMYSESQSVASVWLYTFDMGWIWTRDDFYPYLWRLDDGFWRWYLRNSSNPRWFYNLSSFSWEAR